jgi:hypothetical protein
MAVKIQLRRGATADWPGSLVLDAGEVGVNTTTKQYKVGDGTTTWSALPYWGSGTITQITAGTGLKLNTVAGATSTGGVVTLDVDTAIMMARAIVGAKGQVVVGGGASSPVALPVSGTNNFVLVADSTDTNYGVKWGQVVEASIATSAVTTSKIADINVTTAKIADSNVTTAKIADGAITAIKIADGTILNAEINASAAIALTKLGTGALPTTITVASANIVDGTIVNADINASAAIALSKLGTGALPTAITIASANIVDATITGTDIAAGTITSSNILDATIVNADISASAGIVDTKLATISTTGKVSNSATTATSANTASAIVARDGSGGFAAGSLDIAGGGAFGSYSTLSSNGIVRTGVITTANTPLTTNGPTNTYHATFHRSGTVIGSIYDNGSGVTYNTTSDYRLKENVIPLVDALEIIEMLAPKTYNFISNPTVTEHGFFAHELAEVIPYAVAGQKDAIDEEGNIKPQQVDYSKLVAVLVGAVQELTARVKELENNK